MLSEKHFEELHVESGISEEIIRAIGYETVTKRSELARRGFAMKQRRVPGLLVPLHQPKGGKPVMWQVKPDDPRKNATGRVLKYEFPYGKSPVLDTPPCELMRDVLMTGKDPVFITEGSKKAACAVSHGIPCMSLSGVYNWRTTNKYGVKTTIADLEDIDFSDRVVYLAFDNDSATNEMVYWALVRFAGVLERRGADVYFTVLPQGEAKGLDEFIVSGETMTSLKHLSGKILPPPPIAYYTANDMGMANRVADMYQDELVFDNTNDTWLVWGDGRWIVDRPGNFARRYITDYTDVIREEAKGLPDEREEGERKSPRAKHMDLANVYGNAAPVRGAEQLLRAKLAENEPGFDVKPDLLNTPNGTLDLTTMEFDPEHRPSDRITVMTNASWPTTPEEESCPRWHDFMSERFPDVDTREFIQRMCGLFVTGNSPEKAFFILQGEKDCGKTVFIEFLHWLLGGYGNQVNKETLTKTRNGEGKQQERSVELVGRRYVYVDESASNDQIDDAFIKQITGGDTTIKYRKLYQQVSEAKAEFTLVLATNFKPRITGNDDAIWRRCHLVQFGQSIPKENQIGNFKELLKDEAPGILKWCVDGYRSWRKVGLEAPAEVRAWTSAYKDDNDPLGRFMGECFQIGPDVEGYMTPQSLAMQYAAWCDENDIEAKTLLKPAALSKAVRTRWPVVNEGGRSGRSRKLHHMKPYEEFRSTEGLEDLIEV